MGRRAKTPLHGSFRGTAISGRNGVDAALLPANVLFVTAVNVAEEAIASQGYP